MISLVSSESWGSSSGCGLLPENGVWGHAPLGAFGRAAASPQTRQMRCWPSSERMTNPSPSSERMTNPSPSSERTTNPSSRRKRQDALSLSLVLFPPKPLRWVSAGALLGAVIKTPVLHFFGISVWGAVSLPSGRCGCVGTTPRGVYFGRKTAFSEWVLCADERAVPSCTRCFFGTSVWGWYHYPRRALHAVETLDARGSRRLICRFYAAPVLALCGLNLPSSGYTRHPGP